jgi:hypothetical protein
LVVMAIKRQAATALALQQQRRQHKDKSETSAAPVAPNGHDAVPRESFESNTPEYVGQ